MHNNDYRHDPPVISFVECVSKVRSFPGANEGAVFLASLLGAAGRSVAFQQWQLESVEFREWLRISTFSRRALDSLRYLVVGNCDLGDGKTAETLLGSNDWHYSTLTAPIYDLVAKCTFSELSGAVTSQNLFDSLRKVAGLSNFRSNHISLWMAAAYGLDIVVDASYEDLILGPNPRLFVHWAPFGFGELVAECEKLGRI